MTDVFISYSRKDKEFVRKLHDSLKNAGRDIWVDWEDIPPASDWHNEIFSGIQAAHSFVFVISPDSTSSQVCGEEVSHAVENKKRLIPVLYREVDPGHMHSNISYDNWIYCRDSDNYDAAMQTVFQTLDTDLDYVKFHTRLLVRAREWDSKKRNPSFLLRGEDLKDAEHWQFASADHKPAPIRLHNEYISASHRGQAARQRITIGLLAVGIVIALALSVLAAFLARNANLEAQRANQSQQAAQ